MFYSTNRNEFCVRGNDRMLLCCGSAGKRGREAQTANDAWFLVHTNREPHNVSMGQVWLLSLSAPVLVDWTPSHQGTKVLFDVIPLCHLFFLYFFFVFPPSCFIDDSFLFTVLSLSISLSFFCLYDVFHYIHYIRGPKSVKLCSGLVVSVDYYRDRRRLWGTLLRKSSSRVLEMWPSLVKPSFFTIYQISEIVLLTKKLYCLPKIFVKRFLLVGQRGVYKSLSLCIALKHELARVSAGPSADLSGSARTRRKMVCLLVFVVVIYFHSKLMWSKLLGYTVDTCGLLLLEPRMSATCKQVTCKQLVWSTRIGRNMTIWILCLILGSDPGAASTLEVTGCGVGSLFYTGFQVDPRSSLYTIYLIIIIILFISHLRTLLLPSFKIIWFRKGVYGVSEGGDNRGGRLGIWGGLRPCCTPAESGAIHAFENHDSRIHRMLSSLVSSIWS